MKSVMVVAAAVLTLSACESIPQRYDPNQDQSVACFSRLALEPALAPLSPKVGGLVKFEPTLEARANKTFASEDDKALISAWSKARTACINAGMAYRAQTGPSWSVFQMSQITSAFERIILQLYTGEITFAEFLAKREENILTGQARMNEAARSADEQNRRAQAQRSEEIGKALEALQKVRPQSPQPPQPQQITCHTYQYGAMTQTRCQ